MLTKVMKRVFPMTQPQEQMGHLLPPMLIDPPVRVIYGLQNSVTITQALVVRVPTTGTARD